MKKILFLFLFILVVSSCKDDEGDILAPGNEYTPKIITETYGNAKLVGFVKDKSGNPLAGVTVFFGEEKTLTGSDGKYQLNTLSAGSNKRIWFQKSGYASTQKLADIKEDLPNRIDASLFPIDKTKKMNSDGGKIEGKDFLVEIQPGGFVYSDGRPVEVDVTVEVTTLLTSEDEFLDAFPGEFRGTRVNGTETAIESFGFIDVVLKVASGEPVQLADGVTAIIKIKAPQNSPTTIPMWHYDEDKAKWIEEGVGSLVDGFYTAEVSHFTKWNWDRPIELISRIIGRVVDNSGNPIEGASLIQTGKNRSFQLTTKSIDDGTFEMFTLENFESNIEAQFDIYGSTIINYTTSPNKGQVNNIGDIKFNINIDNVMPPLISGNNLYITIGLTSKINGNYFGKEKRVGYKLLLNGNEVETTTWQNDLIEFVVPEGIAAEGTIKIDRDGVLSRVVNYNEGEWTCEIKGKIYYNDELPLDDDKYYLDLHNRSLKSIPDCIGNLQNLQALDLGANILYSLPESFGNLHSLEWLDLGGNSWLSGLPNSFGNLKSLEWLDLEGNSLGTLPESFGNLHSLEWLDLYENRLRTLPESFGNLQNLNELNLSSNQSFSSFPESFGNLQNLQKLVLQYNKLTTLPESFGNLKSLQVLYITYNELTTLPESFGKLPKLELLRLNNNQLTSLPESFGNLQKLPELRLNNNQLRSLPESIGNLHNLKEFWLDRNQLTALPESFGNLQNLTALYLNNNQFSSLPESISNLKNLVILYLEYNQFSSLPESYGNLSSVRNMILHNNQISSLPESFGNLKSLFELNLNYNQLTTLPESFGNLDNLNKLYLNNNQFSSLPESISNLKNLEMLHLNNNPFSSLPESIKNLKEKLKDLYLEGNNFSKEEIVKIKGWLPNTRIHW